MLVVNRCPAPTSWCRGSRETQATTGADVPHRLHARGSPDVHEAIVHLVGEVREARACALDAAA